MPSVEEWLDGVVEVAIRSTAYECPLCENGVRDDHRKIPAACEICDGGKTKSGATCSLCGGSGQWPKYEVHQVPCDCENGVVLAERHSAIVGWYVMNTCISAAYEARESADFDRANRVIDWAYAFCMEGAAEAMRRMQEDPEFAQGAMDMIRRGGEVQPSQRGITLKANPLTPEELRSLGIEPEDA